MDIKVNCPSCGQHLVVDSAEAGQQTSCPTCASPFIIPAIARVASPPLPMAPDTRQRGMAVFSLVLGIMALLGLGIVPGFYVLMMYGLVWGFAVSILPGISAIFLGHKAHLRTRKLPAQYAGKGMGIAGFILGYISLLLSLGLVVFVFIVDANAKANMQTMFRTSSENNLKMIGLAFRIWAGDHNDQYPFNVSQAQGGTRELCDPDSNGFEKNPVPIFMVMSNELSTTLCLFCSDDKTKQAATNFASLKTNNISYQLRTGANVNANHPDEILAVDPIHGLVLHCDGTVNRDWDYQKKAAK